MSGGGPAATGMIVVMGIFVITFIVAMVSVVLPLGFVAVCTLFLTVVSGYRYLRWCRWLGVGFNATAIAYLFWLFDKRPEWAALAMPVINILLLMLMPRRPNVRMAAGIVSSAHLALGLPLPILGAYLVCKEGIPGWPLLLLVIISTVNFIPFYLNWRGTRKFTIRTVACAATVSLGMLCVWIAVFPALLIPLFLGSVFSF